MQTGERMPKELSQFHHLKDFVDEKGNQWSIDWINSSHPFLSTDQKYTYLNDFRVFDDKVLRFYRDVGPGLKERIEFGPLHNSVIPVTIRHNSPLYHYDDWEFEDLIKLTQV